MSNFSADLCVKCDQRPYDVTCSCSKKLCEPCFQNKHQKKHPSHRRGASKLSAAFWYKVSGKNLGISSPLSRDKCFKDDETSKWFGLHTVVSTTGRVNTIVETKRLSLLMERSIEFHGENSPKRQFPSITSFVGETNAGKSTLVRSLIYQATQECLDRFESIDAPVPADDNVETAALSTTGEVNLYPDPATFGSDCPRLFADCEGIFGTEPVASKYQTEWAKYGRSYLVKTEGDKLMDRRTAVKELYPRFLYIFSDVVCYVMRNHKAWADSALKLLDWSMIGAQSTVNQQSLPALIIVLNGPFIQSENWLSGDEDVITSSFFSAIELEITENARVRKLAALHGSSTMKQLFEKSFSSVHVHYIPQEGYKELGTTDIMCEQYSKLAHRVEFNSIRVQDLRKKAWTRFDIRQLNLVTEFAFKHLASGDSAPFDFDKCRKQLSIPRRLEDKFSSFIQHALKENPEEKLEATAGVLATSILLNSLRVEGRKLIQHPDVVFTKDLQSICVKALESFFAFYRVCKFVDPTTNERCVNLKYGHAVGHQSRTGAILGGGPFVAGDFDTTEFINKIQSTLRKTMESIDGGKALKMARQINWRSLVAEKHKTQLSALRQIQGSPRWMSASEGVMNNGDDVLSKICLGCLFGRVEYVLPCAHYLCVDCLEDFDSTPDGFKYPGNYTHTECVICGASGGNKWPFSIQTRPPLSGLRILSLDGGGVRGIVELTLLKRLEDLVDLGVPLGRFFDLMVGTSAGGMISLGLGIQQRSASECIKIFRKICDDGFHAKPLTTTPALGYMARLLRRSIYKTSQFEATVRSAFGPQPNQVFGRTNSTRVAVTTTVDSETMLIANYNLGDSDKYMRSELPLWKAARCTSAAPMYFKPISNHGLDCHDGGLRFNNPVQLAINECRKLWGSEAHYDLILSVGSGDAASPADVPTAGTTPRSPHWLKPLVAVFISSMNGQKAWEEYIDSQTLKIKEKSFRLNVEFRDGKEPALDATDQVGRMETTAGNAKFQAEMGKTWFTREPASPVYKPDLLLFLADKICSSMFFFQLTSIDEFQRNDIYAIKGWIGCQFQPHEPALSRILDRTHYFEVKGDRKEKNQAGNRYFRLEIEFNQQFDHIPISIEVNFGVNRSVPISGFPMAFEDLKTYWDDNKDSWSDTYHVKYDN